MKKRFWKFPFAVLAAYALQGAELGNKDGAHVGQSVRRVDLLVGRTLADFDCLLTDDKVAITRAYSLSSGVMRVSGEVRAILVTKETYGDFDLSFEINYPESGFGDGGVMLWVKMLPDRPEVHTGMEIQTKTGYLGDLWGLSRFVLSRDAATPPPEGNIDAHTAERYRCIPRLTDTPVVAGQWHHVDFRRRGRGCELKIDGKLVNRCTIAADPGEGRIGFQTRPYDEGKAHILYRNMILTSHDTDVASVPTDLYLLIGQSNMAGRGITNSANRLSSERVLKFTKDRKWAEGVEPIHFDRPFTGAGPGLAFARSMADADGHAVIGLIPCADGGTPLSRWEPGHDLYTNAVSRTKAALASGGRLRGILWNQGEADSWAKETAETYAVRLTNMVTQLRCDLDATDVPFIAGEVGAHYAVSLEKRGKKPYVNEVNAQMKAAIASLPSSAWVSVEGLDAGQDGIHFTTESAYELGRRYARKIQSMPGLLENENKAYGDLHNRIVERIRLWPGFAPHEKESSLGRFAYDTKNKVWRRRDVSQPELVVFRPFGKPRDTMVIVMPGGGYYSQHMGHFCRDSRSILESGRWVAVLHYRIPRREGRKIYDAPREDAARAIRILRANAARLGFSPEKIGAVGYSAGAHLAAISAVSSQDQLYGRVDDIDDCSAHLNFAVPVYPAYVAEDGATGPNARGGDGAAILPEFKFDSKTPPMFMLHGDKDYYSPMASVLLYTELHKRKIPAQLFVYGNVSHGLGDTPNAKGWQKRIIEWFDSIGF